jgi:transcriptional regulator with XRE-family HTH domain
MALEMRCRMAPGRRRGRGIALTAVDRRRIAAAREALGWSVSELAARVAMHQSTLYRLENGTLRSTPRLRAIYEALGLPVERIGRAEADEEELATHYRMIKLRYPAQAELLLSVARSWAHREQGAVSVIPFPERRAAVG